MQRLQFSQVKDVCGAALNLLPDDPRLKEKVNEVQERLLYDKKWVGTTVRMRICATNSCLVWPREIETIEAVNICDLPGEIRNGWYEYMRAGPGPVTETGPCLTLVDRGEVPAFDEVTGAGKKLAVFAERTESSNKYITLQFYNAFGQWVRSTFDGEVIDGERLLIPSAGQYVYTTNQVAPAGLTRVYKDATDGVIRLFEYNTTNGALKALGAYQPDETVPIYRASILPGISEWASGNGSCEAVKVTVIAKLRYIPVARDDDFLMISHRGALRLGCQALQKEEADRPDEAVKFWALCQKALQDQVQHFHGTGAKMTLQMEGGGIWGGGIPAVQ